MPKRAFITGVTGQDGSYLAEFLLAKGYEVHGLVRRTSTPNTTRIGHLLSGSSGVSGRFHLHQGDLAEGPGLIGLLGEIRPDEIYNLGAMSHVKVSFDIPEYTADVDGLGSLRLLEAVRILGIAGKARIYQASTSELFGKVAEVPQSETTPFHPRSPYGVAKLYAYWITRHYREAYGMFASNGILFNHESERRGESFVTRKISLAVANIVHGRQQMLRLGNLSARRDWGYAPDFVQCMWLILQHRQPDDFVIATGETRTVREFCDHAFRRAGLELEWRGEGAAEQGVERRTGRVLVAVDPAYFRPAEVDLLLGDPAKAVRELGWNPRGTSFEQLVRRMVDSDLAAVARELR